MADLKQQSAFDAAWKHTCPICNKRILFFRNCEHKKEFDSVDAYNEHLSSNTSILIKRIIITF